ncbi:MAG: hypothetical protein ACKVPX_12975 [Myxococcaceae bacterium]
MSHPNRLESLTPTETVARQTPKRDFGSLLADNLGSVFSKGAGLVSRALGSAPLLSTAVSGVQSVVSTASASHATPAVYSAGGVMGAGMARNAAFGNGGLSSPAIQELLAKMENGGELNPSEYLILQRAMQQENQQYTAASNILKVRADSAKAAINNIR